MVNEAGSINRSDRSYKEHVGSSSRDDGTDFFVSGRRGQAVIEWLKLNEPTSIDEIDVLKRLILNFKAVDGVHIGYYGIRAVYGQRLIVGPSSLVFISDDEDQVTLS